MSAFVDALRSFGWIDEKNIRIDYRYTAGDSTLYNAYAAELVRLSPDAILTSGPAALAAMQQQTRTIPIVFIFAPDPVGMGLVQSLAQPGGMTSPDIFLLPSLSREIDAAAGSLGMTVTLGMVLDDAAIEETIATLAREPGGGLIILPGILNFAHRSVIAAAAARYRLPSIGPNFLPEAGGLISYWFDTSIISPQAASYIDRILRGANPAELPVQQPTKYSLIINLKTAKALGLTVPPSMLDLADEVIE